MPVQPRLWVGLGVSQAPWPILGLGRAVPSSTRLQGTWGLQQPCAFLGDGMEGSLRGKQQCNPRPP